MYIMYMYRYRYIYHIYNIYNIYNQYDLVYLCLDLTESAQKHVRYWFLLLLYWLYFDNVNTFFTENKQKNIE